MKTDSIIVKSAEREIPCIIWQPDTLPNAILIAVHGMTEHAGRYKQFGERLSAAGLALVCYDLPGHGHNLPQNSCATFGKDGWKTSLEDLHNINQTIKEIYINIPVFTLGFSLGSFIVREYINLFPSDSCGTIIIGTGNQPAIILGLMQAIVKKQIDKAGFDNATPLIKKLSFETYNNNFKPNRTDSDWLCSDVNQLDQYINDSLCRNSISAGLFYDLLTAMKNTGRIAALDNADKRLPVLLLSGDKDPVGNNGKGVQQVKQLFEKAEFKNIQMHLFPDARHDLLHEYTSGNANKAISIIIDWIDENI